MFLSDFLAQPLLVLNDGVSLMLSLPLCSNSNPLILWDRLSSSGLVKTTTFFFYFGKWTTFMSPDLIQYLDQKCWMLMCCKCRLAIMCLFFEEHFTLVIMH